MIARHRRYLAVVALIACVLTSSRPGAARVIAADAIAEVDEIRWQVARVRGLEPRAEVPLEVVDRATFRDGLATAAANPRSRREVMTNRKLLILLGLLTPEFDLDSFTTDLLGVDVAGVYNRREQRMYLVSDAASLSGRDKLTVAHELTHVLQDQHFGLASLVPAGTADNDRSMAGRALIEGDATLAMLLWGRQFLTPDEKRGLANREPGQTSPLADAPLLIRQELLFPYQEGVEFVRGLYERGGFDAVNQAFLEPPQSTEQVIHPEKYQAREGPRDVPLRVPVDVLGPEWRLLKTDVLGELDLRILLQQLVPDAEPSAAAAGWGGDRYTLLEDEGGRLLLVLATVWDTEEDAAAFFNAYVMTVDRRFPTGRRTLDRPSLLRWSTPIGPIQLLKTGGRVLLVAAPDDATLDKVAAFLST